MLIERVRSKPENFPLAVEPTFRPRVDLGVVPELLEKMEAVSRSAKNLLKNSIPVMIYIDGEKLSISGYSKAEDTRIATAKGKGRIAVRPDDFSAVTAAISSIEVQGEISVAVDNDMLVISFETEFATYGIHVPTTLQGLARSNRCILKLAPVAWPESEDGAKPAPVPNGDNLADENASEA